MLLRLRQRVGILRLKDSCETKRFLSSNDIVDKSQNDSSITKQIKHKNEPFIKTLYSGKYLNEYMTFPGLSSDELKELKHFSNPIVDYFNKNKQNYIENDKRIIDFNLYSSIVPKVFNGLELDSITRSFMYENIALNTNLALNLLIHNEIVTKALLLYGTNEQREAYLSKLSSGQLKGVLCYQENNHTLDTINFETTVDNDMILNGRKDHVVVAENENDDVLYLVVAKITNKNHEPIGMRGYFVDGKTAGITRTRINSSISNIFFKNVEIKPENQIGIDLSGHNLIKNLFDSSYYLIGSIVLGMLKDLYKIKVNYTIEKKLFDKSMHEYLHIKEDLAINECSIYALESMIYMTAGIFDTYLDVDAGVESSLTKIYSIQSLLKSLNDCKNLTTIDFNSKTKDYFELINIISHYPVPNDLLKLENSTQCLVGSSLQLLDKVQKLRSPLENPKILFKTFGERWKLTKYLNQDLSKTGKSYFYLWENVHPSLKLSCSYLEQASIRLTMGAEQCLVDFGSTLVDNHIALRRLSDISMEIYAMNASIARCSRSYSIGLPNCDHEVKLTNSLCYYANKRVEYLYNELITTRNGRNVDDLLLNIANRSLKDKQISNTHCLERSYD
jgi:acyl-CoA dehydrogenase family member 9